MAEAVKIVVLEGDQTGQELLEQSLRLLNPALLGIEIELERFRPLPRASAGHREPGRDRRRGGDAGGRSGAQGGHDHPGGQGRCRLPERILREGIGGKVIVRTGRRLPGVAPMAGVHYPISIVRMAAVDAYGAKQWREGDAGDRRRSPTGRDDHPLHLSRRLRVRLPRRRAPRGPRLRRPEVDGLARVRGYAQGRAGRRRRAPPRRRVPAGPDRRDIRRLDVGRHRHRL